jgi:lysophospholipase L1-like esterase
MIALFALFAATAVSAETARDEATLAAPVEDPTGVALDSFFVALARTEAGTAGAITRVMHMGDSSIGLDGLPHALRRRMQDRFGDGGAGFVLVDRKSKNYENRAALLTATGWNVCYIPYKCDPSGRYGYGGHWFRGREGASTKLRTRTKGNYGRSVSRFELWYETDRRGGLLSVRVDTGDWEKLDTYADAEPVAQWREFDVEPGAHSIELRWGGRGKPKAYGVVMETDGPGVVWDTLSMIGTFTPRLQAYDTPHMHEHVAHRAPNLLVFGYGGNDLRRFATDSVTHEEFVAETRDVLSRVRGAKPGTACLVVGVIDHVRAGPRQIAKRHLERMVAAQREAALAEGCAFFDALAAMGGPGSIRKWRKTSPPLSEPDLQHLSMHGRDRMAEMIFDAVMQRYDAYKARQTPAAR